MQNLHGNRGDRGAGRGCCVYEFLLLRVFLSSASFLVVPLHSIRARKAVLTAQAAFEKPYPKDGPFHF